MNKVKKLSLSIAVAAALYAAPSLLSVPFVTSVAVAAEQDAAPAQKTYQVPTMRDRVYKHLSLAQQAGDKEGVAVGLAKLDEVKEHIDELNAYERAMMWNFYGFMHYGNEDAVNALSAFENVIAQGTIPATLRLSTLRSIAQLNMMQERYDVALEYLSLWQAETTQDVKATDYVMFAQNYYQIKQYDNALTAIEKAIDLVEANGELAKENWLILQRAAYFENKQPEKVTEVLEKLVRLYNKPEYWIQLAGMYGELEQEDKQLGTMEAAWLAGYITKGADMLNLAQLYLYNNVPFKAAKVIEQGMAEGKIGRDEKNLQLISQSYLMAKNDDLAIEPLREAAGKATHGNFDAQLAEIYVNTEQWGEAIDAAVTALEKGNLNNPGNMHMALGMANFNLLQFDLSLLALEKAKGFNQTNNMASQWIKYVSNEKTTQQRGYL